MRITFILPFADLSGGVRVVATYAKILHERGHIVTVVSQPPKRHGSFLKRALNTVRRKNSSNPISTKLLETLGDKHIICDQAEKESFLRHVPDADIVVATWWETAEWVNEMPREKGAKVYLLQDYEVFPYLPVERVISTYKLPFHKIAVSSYISSTLKLNHCISDVDIVPNAVDVGTFERRERRKRNGLRIGFLYSQAERKNIRLAIDSLNSIKILHPDISAIVFGKSDISTAESLPEWVIYRKAPPEAEIPSIYAQCDVWLFTSRSEGFGLPILEAMACGTPVIATKAGAAPSIINGKNGSLVEASVEGFVSELNRYYNMKHDKWVKMSTEAMDTAHSYSWNDATDHLLNCFERYTNVSAVTS